MTRGRGQNTKIYGSPLGLRDDFNKRTKAVSMCIIHLL